MAASNPIVVSKSLTTIKLDHLRAGDDAESKKLLRACQDQGFFYLDLSSDPELCALWEGMVARMKHYFNQSLDVKMQDARNSDNYGQVYYQCDLLVYQSLTNLSSYLPVGTEVGSKPETKDGYETLKVFHRPLGSLYAAPKPVDPELLL